MKKNVMNEKKMQRVLSLAMTGIMAVSLVGCSATGQSSGTGNEDGNAETTASTTNQGKKDTKKSPLDPSNPTPITIWNYYNGDQQAAFDSLVSEFNDTVGTEEGIIVSAVSQGSIDNLADSLIDAAAGKIGAQELPAMASVYAETAFILDQQDLLVNLDDYFSTEELAAYIPGFIEEGRMIDDGDLLLFPVSKSTECFAVNTTDWSEFENATGTTVESIDSYESLTEAAQSYYEWTDSLTPDVPEDGKALYGRDSVANYIYIGSIQLGHELFKVDASGMTMDLDHDTFKKLWDNYYVPFINGYFAADSSHRSEDMKTGRILAMTGSTSGISYLPTSVVDVNDVSHDIQLMIDKPLTFKDGKTIAVQQGAGYCVLKGTEEEQYAAVKFLKWFTESDRNLKFSVSSGYSAVTMDANSTDKLKANFSGTGDTVKDENILNALLTSADVYMNEETYTNKPFKGSKDVRDVLANALSDIAVADREAVVKSMEDGATREEAVAPFITDEHFDSWFNTLCEKVKKTVE